MYTNHQIIRTSQNENNVNATPWWDKYYFQPRMLPDRMPTSSVLNLNILKQLPRSEKQEYLQILTKLKYGLRLNDYEAKIKDNALNFANKNPILQKEIEFIDKKLPENILSKRNLGFELDDVDVQDIKSASEWLEKNPNYKKVLEFEKNKNILNKAFFNPSNAEQISGFDEAKKYFTDPKNKLFLQQQENKLLRPKIPSSGGGKAFEAIKALSSKFGFLKPLLRIAGPVFATLNAVPAIIGLADDLNKHGINQMYNDPHLRAKMLENLVSLGSVISMVIPPPVGWVVSAGLAALQPLFAKQREELEKNWNNFTNILETHISKISGTPNAYGAKIALDSELRRNDLYTEIYSEDKRYEKKYDEFLKKIGFETNASSNNNQRQAKLSDKIYAPEPIADNELLHINRIAIAGMMKAIKLMDKYELYEQADSAQDIVKKIY